MANEVKVTPRRITIELLRELEQRGLIAIFRPAELEVPAGQTIAESIYECPESFGPHKLIYVGVNKDFVQLGVHPEREEFLIPLLETRVKPVYLLICHLKEAEIREKESSGTLSAEDFTCLDLFTAPRGAEMFTMLGGTVHCEFTIPGDGRIGCFFVTESQNLPISWVDLVQTSIQLT